MKIALQEHDKPAIGNGSKGGTPSEASDSAERIGRSIAYMVEHLGKPMQVSTLAAQADASPSHFFALFKRQTGTAPMVFFTRLRMNHARELLYSTHSSVKEIAAALGYEDQFYFSRVFKSVHRVGPAEYRKRNGWARPVGRSKVGRLAQPLTISTRGIGVKESNIHSFHGLITRNATPC